MFVTMVNHASVFIEDGDIGLLSDPWFFGTVFNDSWALEFETPKKVIANVLEKTTHLYISHEHPDHMHFPTLKEICGKFKNKITLYIQDLPRKEVLNALKKIGYSNIVEVKHREKLELNENLSLYMYSVFPVDSALALIKRQPGKDSKVILNVNDTDLCRYDLRKIKSDIGKVDMILTQFSFATYNGNSDINAETRKMRKDMIDSFVEEHKHFEAKVSVPFASYSYFCTHDNNILNEYKTKPSMLKKVLSENKLNNKFLLPGQKINLDNLESFKESSLSEFENFKTPLKIFETSTVSVDDLRDSFHKCHAHLVNSYPKFIVKLIGDFSISCPDLKRKINVNFRDNKFSELSISEEFDLIVNSQPLMYAFANSWGMNSLTIGGRLVIYTKKRSFMFLRILLALGNSNMKFKLNRDSRTTYSFLFRNFGRIFFQAMSTFQNLVLFRQEYNQSIDDRD